MKPYYQDERCIIYHGDCREVMPELGKFDLLLTDPPYGIGVNHNMGRRSGGARSQYEKADWDKSPPDKSVFDLMFAISQDKIVWGANHFVDLMPIRSSCWLVWDKLFSDEVSFATCELAFTSHGGVVRRLKCSSQRREGLHPTQKPIVLMRWCLSFFPDAKTILDPFLGSGTTLVAAKLEGRQAVGIELEELYCEIAAKRLAQGVLF